MTSHEFPTDFRNLFDENTTEDVVAMQLIDILDNFGEETMGSDWRAHQVQDFTLEKRFSRALSPVRKDVDEAKVMEAVEFTFIGDSDYSDERDRVERFHNYTARYFNSVMTNPSDIPLPHRGHFIDHFLVNYRQEFGLVNDDVEDGVYKPVTVDSFGPGGLNMDDAFDTCLQIIEDSESGLYAGTETIYTVNGRSHRIHLAQNIGYILMNDFISVMEFDSAEKPRNTPAHIGSIDGMSDEYVPGFPHAGGMALHDANVVDPFEMALIEHDFQRLIRADYKTGSMHGTTYAQHGRNILGIVASIRNQRME